jgi:hypothetical protein
MSKIKNYIYIYIYIYSMERFFSLLYGWRSIGPVNELSFIATRTVGQDIM